MATTRVRTSLVNPPDRSARDKFGRKSGMTVNLTKSGDRSNIKPAKSRVTSKKKSK